MAQKATAARVSRLGRAARAIAKRLPTAEPPSARAPLRGVVLAALAAALITAFCAGPASALPPTTTTLTSSANPSVVGQSVTLTATVTSPGGTPGGTVTFYDDTTQLGSGTLSGGKATLTTTSLFSATLTAAYGGSPSFDTSSGTVPQVVNKGSTTTTLTSSVNPSVVGQSVTFTATVDVNAPASGTPTGTVIFSDETTSFPPVTLSGGKASFTISSLPSGGHTITASYSGDTNFELSAVSLTQTVNPLFTLTIVPAGTGAGTVTSNPAGIDCSASSNECAAMFASGTQVTLTASAAAGSSFTGWSGGGCTGTTAPCTVTLSANVSVAATFTVIPSFLLSVTEAGTGSGTVTSNLSGINCPGACSASFQSGTQVVLTATPAAVGSIFAGWSGAGCTGTGTCTVAMTAAQGVTAIFTLTNATLTVTEAGTGAGRVTSSPAGINCSASSSKCAAPFPINSPVTLTASASSGSSFSGWSGGGCSGTGTCVVTMSAAESVKATFKLSQSTKMLSVALTGGGSGTVTSSPSGINCGPTCAASFDTGTQITLTAAAAASSTFAGWSGGGCSGIDGCVLTLDAATTVTASFVANTPGNLTLVAAVLPTSRSVEIGATPTAFATMINAGPDNAATCTIAPATSIPADFVFQTTDPSTNALTGTPNTPVNIAAGQAGTFVVAFTPTAAFPPTDVAFIFTCANAPGPAATTVGVDTLNLSASTTPVPDIVALAASGDPGYVDIPGATGTGVFAVATVNLGIDATITAAANTGTANLPVTLLLCQTDPTSGACLAAPAPTVATDIPPNATPTFGVFVTGSAPVADMPGVNRVFVTFTDAGGVLRGETSVAVRTQ